MCMYIKCFLVVGFIGVCVFGACSPTSIILLNILQVNYSKWNSFNGPVYIGLVGLYIFISIFFLLV